MNITSGLHVLVLQTASGDAQAQADLAELVHPALTRYVSRRFGSEFDEEDVQEIVSQSILTIYIHARSYRGRFQDPSAWRWAYKIARSQAQKWIKAQNKLVRFPEMDGSQGTDDEFVVNAFLVKHKIELVEDGVEDQALERILSEQVADFIRHLNLRDQHILYWYYVQQITLDEIAQKIQVTRPRVHQLLQSIHIKCRGAIRWEYP